MTDQKLTGVFINANNLKASEVTIIDNLNNIYELLNCNLIDVVQRNIAGKDYNIICDDEGFLKPDLIFTARNLNFSEDCIVGNLFVVSSDENGEFLSLDKDEIKEIIDDFNEFSQLKIFFNESEYKKYIRQYQDDEMER